ncbi:diacylglycerol kinase catalytic domain-containing protein [Methylomarinum vadi]|uniref:sugar kinase n=1 Tax=Methylomarinum vadi TaxID=438855 RepID=UPI0004DEE559|nr:sugar kinase [Methylomarinum vadi]
MNGKNQYRFILVTRQTRLQELIERFNTWPQARFYLEHNQVDARDYLVEHDLYQRRLQEAERILKTLGRFQQLERRLLPQYQFGPSDIVVVIGQDGLVANTLKYLSGQPVIAINPDPERWDGKLLPFEIGDLQNAVTRTLTGKADCKTITFAEAKTNDGQRMLAVNDLFVGPKSHSSARYSLSWNGRRENQSSSGIIISTGFGSSGWFQSILAGAYGVAGSMPDELNNGFAWHERRLQFTVREPFPSKTTVVELVFGAITPDTPLKLESQMPENGVIFSDGIESDYLAFNSGTVTTIGVAETQGQLVC